MKRILILLIFLLLTGCSQKTDYIEENLIVLDQLYYDQDEYEVFESIEDHIRLRLYVEKDRRVDSHISVFSTVEYIGSEDQVTIHHGFPLLGYTLSKEDIDYNINIVQTILIESQLEKGKIYVIPFSKTGAYDEKDDQKAEKKAYLEDPELRLPQGTYTLTSVCNFDFPNQAYDNAVTMTLEVQEVE